MVQTVIRSGETVFIEGQGFSVAPELQDIFIQQQQAVRVQPKPIQSILPPISTGSVIRIDPEGSQQSERLAFERQQDFQQQQETRFIPGKGWQSIAPQQPTIIRKGEVLEVGKVDRLSAVETGADLYSQGYSGVVLKGDEIGLDKDQTYMGSYEDLKKMFKGRAGYESAETIARRKITYPLADMIYEKTGLTSEIAGQYIARGPFKLGEGVTDKTKQEINLQAIAIDSFFQSIKEKPVKTGATAGVFFALSPILKGAGYVVKKAGVSVAFTKTPATAKVIKTGGKLLKWALPTAYVGSVGYRVIKQETPEERAEMFGEILGTEVLPMAVGSYAGAKFWPKAEGWWRTRGRKPAPTENVVMKEALEGETYPSAKIEEHMNKFQTESQRLVVKLKGYTGEGEFISSAEAINLPVKVQPKLYHSAGESFWAKGDGFEVTKTGDSEFKGLFGGSGVSPRFLRITDKTSGYGGKFFEPYTTPGTAVIIPDEFIPALKGKPGQAFVPGAAGFKKTEIQAILSVGTEVKKISSEYYYVWKGQRIPLDVFKTIKTTGTGASGIIASEMGPTIKNILSSSSYGAGSSYVRTPGSYALGLGISSDFEITSPSYKPTSTYKPSKYSSSSISKDYEVISYKPSSTYKPSKPSTPKISSSYEPIGSFEPISSYKPTSSPPSSPPSSYPPSYPPSKPPFRPPIIPPGLLIPKLKGKPKRTRIGWKPYGKSVKTKKYVALSKNLLTRQGALDLMSEGLDKSLSASGKIVPHKTNKDLLFGSGYFGKNTKKFREYKIRKGTKIDTPRYFKEKRKYRLDLKNEQQSIQQWKKRNKLQTSSRTIKGGIDLIK